MKHFLPIYVLTNDVVCIGTSVSALSWRLDSGSTKIQSSNTVCTLRYSNWQKYLVQTCQRLGMLAFDLSNFDKLHLSLVVIYFTSMKWYLHRWRMPEGRYIVSIFEILEHPAWRCNAYEHCLIVTSFSLVLKHQIRNRKETYHSAAYVL